MARVLQIFEPAEGGVAEVVGRLAHGLEAHGFAIELAGPGWSRAYAGLEGTIPVHRLPLHPGFGQPGDDARAVRRLISLLRSGRFDLVHCHSARAGVLGRIAAAAARVPAVYSPHSFPFVGDFSEARRRAVTVLERALGPLTARVICVCQVERRQALASRVAPERKLRLVYNGAADCDASVAPDPQLTALRAGGPVAATVAMLRPQKRVDVFIDAAPLILEQVPQARLAVVGDGPLNADLHDQAARLGLLEDPRFAFIPFEGPSHRYLRASDVYVLSSGWEAFPIGVLEAQACGVPQVATDVGGTSEAVDAHTGRLVPPGDPAALAAATAELLLDDVTRERLGTASRTRHATRFSVGRMVAETAAVYRDVLADGS